MTLRINRSTLPWVNRTYSHSETTVVQPTPEQVEGWWSGELPESEYPTLPNVWSIRPLFEKLRASVDYDRPPLRGIPFRSDDHDTTWIGRLPYSRASTLIGAPRGLKLYRKEGYIISVVHTATSSQLFDISVTTNGEYRAGVPISYVPIPPSLGPRVWNFLRPLLCYLVKEEAGTHFVELPPQGDSPYTRLLFGYNGNFTHTVSHDGDGVYIATAAKAITELQLRLVQEIDRHRKHHLRQCVRALSTNLPALLAKRRYEDITCGTIALHLNVPKVRDDVLSLVDHPQQAVRSLVWLLTEGQGSPLADRVLRSVTNLAEAEDDRYDAITGRLTVDAELQGSQDPLTVARALDPEERRVHQQAVSTRTIPSRSDTPHDRTLREQTEAIQQAVRAATAEAGTPTVSEVQQRVPDIPLRRLPSVPGMQPNPEVYAVPPDAGG